jgi:hypothetical protein
MLFSDTIDASFSRLSIKPTLSLIQSILVNALVVIVRLFRFPRSRRMIGFRTFLFEDRRAGILLHSKHSMNDIQPIFLGARV